MPQFSKVRVVNFYYNDGFRLIPDTIFPFCNADGDALHSLVNLKNGGGKSVLLQLMCQVVVPEAKISKRKFSDFFKKSSDHCFILIEWILDNPSQRLLTGIAVAPGETSFSDTCEDTPQARGVHLKYYTFISEYSIYGSDTDIEHLKLSENIGNRFKPLPYETVRELSKSHSNNLECFASNSERQREYRKRLESYGISRNEWVNVICQVNQEEGGIPNYFKSIETSDALLDNLLINAIEQKLQANEDRAEDASLVTMVRNYAKAFQAQAKEIETRDFAKNFQKELISIQPSVDSVWSLNDSYIKSIDTLFGFGNALATGVQKLVDEIAIYEKTLLDCKDEQAKIQLEEASDVFYQAVHRYESAFHALQEAEEHEKRQQEEKKKLEFTYKAMQCAGLYSDINRHKAEVKAWTKKIEELQGDTEIKDRLASLKYSIHVIAEDEISKTMPVFDAVGKEIDSLNDLVCQIQAELDRLDKELNALNAKVQNLEGCLSVERNGLLQQSERLCIDLIQTLDDSFDRQHLLFRETEEQAEKENISSHIQHLKSESDSNISMLRQLETDLAALYEKRQEPRSKQEKIQAEITSFHELEEKLVPIYRRHSLDFELRFTSVCKEKLLQTSDTISAEISALERKWYILEEQLNAVEQGTVHIPHTVIKYLKSLPIKFQTCEQYLRECELPPARVISILEKYPACAYGILLTKDDVQVLMSSERADWLPSMIPIYDYDYMDGMIQERYAPSSRALACYSKEYFLNREDYNERLLAIKSSNEAKRKQLEAEKRRIIDESKLVDVFSQYSKSWLSDKEAELDDVSLQLSRIKDEIKGCRLEADLLRKRNTEIHDEIILKNSELSKKDHWFFDLSRLVEALDRYDSYLKDYYEAKKRQQEYSSEKDSKSHLFQEKRALLDERKAREKDLREILDKLNLYLLETKNAPESKLLSADLDQLYVEYHELLINSNNDIKVYQKLIETASGDVRKLTVQINGFKLAESDYIAVVYSEDREAQLRLDFEFAGEELDRLQKITSEKNRELGKAESNKETAFKAVKALATEPLPESEIFYNFAHRREAVKNRSDVSLKKKESATSLRFIYKSNLDVCEDFFVNLSPTNFVDVELQQDVTAQRKALFQEKSSIHAKFKAAEKELYASIDRIKEEFTGQDEFLSSLTRLQKITESTSMTGDRYFTLSEIVANDIKNVELLIRSIDAELQDIDNQWNDLLRQCVLQGERIYNELQLIMSSSRVKFNGRQSSIHMLKINIPGEIDELVAQTRINHTVHEGIKAMISSMDNGATEADIIRASKKLVGSRKLLNLYVGQEDFVVQVFKFDSNAKNSKYRTWEDALVQNSGGEKIVPFFAVLLSLINYSRNNGHVQDAKNVKSVLLLDNPFGPVTSGHLIEPMFDIARHFKVQLICFSHINTSEVVKFFDSVVMVHIKPTPLSNMEIVSAEVPEEVEHAFFRAEQTTLY